MEQEVKEKYKVVKKVVNATVHEVGEELVREVKDIKEAWEEFGDGIKKVGKETGEEFGDDVKKILDGKK